MLLVSILHDPARARTMAQHKYDLLTVPTVSDAPRKHHPWYKERLKLKFNTSKQSAALNGQRWTFVSSNMDDFRSGVPRKTRAHHMIKHRRTSSFPLITKVATTQPQKLKPPQQRIITNNPGQRTLYSKVGPRKQVQEERLEREKQALLKYPLQLYPHLEDSIPIEILDEVLEVLDPELKVDAPSVEEASHSPFDTFSSISSHAEEEKSEEKSADDVFSPTQSIRFQTPLRQEDSPPQPSNVYKFPLTKTQEEHERERMMAASQQAVSASQQSRVDQVTRDLVQWMKDLNENETDDQGDECNQVDESMIKSLFSSDCESRPAQMAPVHVVELLNVPAELQIESGGGSHSGSYYCRPSSKYGSSGENQFMYGNSRMRGLTYPNSDLGEPRYVRSKYGAWYLPVGLWQYTSETEPLRDPNEDTADVDSEEAMKSLAMDSALSELHGAKTFKEFILTKKKGTKMPVFLHGVDSNCSRHQL